MSVRKLYIRLKLNLLRLESATVRVMNRLALTDPFVARSFFVRALCPFLILTLRPILIMMLHLQLLNVLLSELSDVFALLPDAHAWHAVFARSQHTSTMLLTIEPLTSVDTTIGPLESALTFFDIVDEVTFILASIWPDK